MSRKERKAARVARREELINQFAASSAKGQIVATLAAGLCAAGLLAGIMWGVNGVVNQEPSSPKKVEKSIDITEKQPQEPSQFEGINPEGVPETFTEASGAPKGVQPETDALFFPPADLSNTEVFARWCVGALGTSPVQHKLPVEKLTAQWQTLMSDASTSRLENYDSKFQNNVFQLMYLGESKETSINITGMKELVGLSKQEVRDYWGTDLWAKHFRPVDFSEVRVFKIGYTAMQDDPGSQELSSIAIDENEVYVYVSTRFENGKRVNYLETMTQTRDGQALSHTYAPKHNRK